MSNPKKVKLQIEAEGDLLERLDAMGAKSERTRSQVVADALKAWEYVLKNGEEDDELILRKKDGTETVIVKVEDPKNDVVS